MAEPVLLPLETLMVLVHDGLRFSLASAPALIESTRGDDVRRSLITDYYTNLLFGLHVHHDGEDKVLFPLLIERFPEERAKVELGLKQHHEVASFAADANVAVTEWGTKGDIESTNVLAALEALDQSLSVHLEYEETTIVPIESHLTSEERRTWRARDLDHHTAMIPNMTAFLFSASRGRSFLWEAVGETSFRKMIAEVRHSD